MSMASRTSNGVPAERTGWRDEELSRRHREWGFNSPCVDIDYLLVEYNLCEPAGLADYKHFPARIPPATEPNRRVLARLAERASLPFWYALYWSEPLRFRVYPANALAERYFDPPFEDLSEHGYVHRLFEMRKVAAKDRLPSGLSMELPPVVPATALTTSSALRGGL